MKILIIDDEVLIKQKLERVVKDAVHGIHSVTAVSDSVKALEIIQKEHPEIVLTDIRMPGITGLELARHIYESGYHAKVIFITGYSEFQYAQAGIAYQVSEYLLKPVDEQEAAKCIKRVIAEYTEEKRYQDMYQMFQNYFAEHLEVAQQQFLEKLFFHPTAFSCQQAEEQKRQLQIELNSFRVVAASFSTKNGMFEEESYYGYMMTEYFRKQKSKILSCEQGGIFYLIWPCCEKEGSDWEFCNCVEAVKKELEQLYPIRISLGISCVSADLTEIRKLKKQVLSCLEYGKSLGKDGIVTFGELPKTYGQETYFDVMEAVTELIQQLQGGKKEGVKAAARRILEQSVGKCEEFRQNIIELIVSNVTLFLSGLSIAPGEKEKLLGSLEDQIRVQSSNRIKEEYLEYWLEYVTDILRNLQSGEQNVLIQSIYDYIDKNFSKQISLTDLSEYVGRNPSYVSRLVKQYSGKNFSQILLERRIEEAKKLLRSTTLKVSRIAEQVGYPNIQYFNRVFAGQMDMSPGEYRKITAYF